MSKKKKQLVGEIGYCDNKILGFKDEKGRIISGGHYVYIREVNGSKCNVNIITSLEDKRHYYDLHKIGKVKKGQLYALPKDDTNFSRWSAINLDGNINDIKISDIHNIGYKKIKSRHKFFVGKFTKKKK